MVALFVPDASALIAVQALRPFRLFSTLPALREFTSSMGSTFLVALPLMFTVFFASACYVHTISNRAYALCTQRSLA